MYYDIVMLGGDTMPENAEKKRFDKQKYDNEYIKNNYDRINFTMPKGTKDRIKAAAEKQGVKPAEFIRQAIDEKLKSVE